MATYTVGSEWEAKRYRMSNLVCSGVECFQRRLYSVNQGMSLVKNLRLQPEIIPSSDVQTAGTAIQWRHYRYKYGGLRRPDNMQTWITSINVCDVYFWYLQSLNQF